MIIVGEHVGDRCVEHPLAIFKLGIVLSNSITPSAMVMGGVPQFMDRLTDVYIYIYNYIYMLYNI